MINSVLSILAIVVLVLLAGLFGGVETGMYRLSLLRLRLGVEKKRFSSLVLSKALKDSPGLLLSMLVGTSLAHYLATGIVTFLMLSTFHAEHTAELLATVITAPTLFIFSELIPKNLFFYRADHLMPFFSPIFYAFQKLFNALMVVPFLKIFSRFFARLAGASVSAKTVVSDAQQHHFKGILQETREEDFLSPVQTDIINRLVAIPHIRIRTVMIPIAKVRMLPKHADKQQLLAKLKEYPFTRLPVYDRWPANIVGSVNIYNALKQTSSFTSLSDFIQPMRHLSEETNVLDAISTMQKENQKMILVTRSARLGKHKPVGIVTMKDLVEELIGELTEW